MERDLGTRVAERVVGREREIELILAAVNAGRDLLLEGPPGTSKTTLLKAITSAYGIPLVSVEGNPELTPGRLLGHHDPARVLAEGYSDDAFVPGALTRAMQSGGFLYFEEFNRAPEDTLNTLLTAIADRRLAIPRFGTVEALPTFRLIGSMNPYDNVGTTRLSVSIKDRLNRLVIDYQDAPSEERIVSRRCREAVDVEPAPRIIADSVAVTRATRSHQQVTQGSSVRGAIDLALIAGELCRTRGIDPDRSDGYREAIWDAMLLALSGRLSLDFAVADNEQLVLREIWEEHFLLAGVAARPGANPEGLEDPDGLRARPDRADPADRANWPAKPRPKRLDAEPSLTTGASGGGIAGEQGAPGRRRDGEEGSGTSSDAAALDDEEGEPAGLSRQAQARAEEIATRLQLAEPPRLARPRPGGSEMLSLPYSGSGGELDLDRALEVLVDSPHPRSEELAVLERRRTRREVVLVVDASGSMAGERLLTAAATVGALASWLHREQLAVIGFWSDAAAVLRLGERAPLPHLVAAILSLEARGLTNLCFPLELAREEFASPGSAEQRVIVLSDCVHNAGPDPRRAASLLPRLDVLFDVAGERDSEMAAEIARAGRGELHPIRHYREVAPALARMLGPE